MEHPAAILLYGIFCFVVGCIASCSYKETSMQIDCRELGVTMSFTGRITDCKPRKEAQK